MNELFSRWSKLPNQLKIKPELKISLLAFLAVMLIFVLVGLPSTPFALIAITKKKTANTKQEELLIPAQKLAQVLAMNSCPKEFLDIAYDSKANTQKLISGLRVFQARLKKSANSSTSNLMELALQAQQDNSNLSEDLAKCLVPLSVSADPGASIAAPSVELIAASLGSESIACSDSQAYLKSTKGTAKYYLLNKTITNYSKYLKDKKIVLELKRNLPALKAARKNISSKKKDAQLKADQDIGKVSVAIEYANLFLKEGDSLAAFFDAVCVQPIRNEVIITSIPTVLSEIATATPTEVPVTVTGIATATATSISATLTSTPTATSMPLTVTRTATATSTNVPPTFTSTPTNTAIRTATATTTIIPPTFTSTPKSTATRTLTATSTNVPPTFTRAPTSTSTSVPVTATRTPTARATTTRIPKPTIISPKPATPGKPTVDADSEGYVEIVWTAPGNAAAYLIRAQDLTDPNARYVDHTNGAIYAFENGYTTTTSSYKLPVTAGHTYHFWMHAITSEYVYENTDTWSLQETVDFTVSTGGLTCSGADTQSCSDIANGAGSQSRTCNTTTGVWSAWSACVAVSCNQGYHISGTICIADTTATPPPGTQISQQRIMPLGDSITYGFNGSNYPNIINPPGGYRRELGVRLANLGFPYDFVGASVANPAYGIDPEHNGYPGNRTDQILTNLPTWLNTNPDIALIHLGTNDMIQHVTIDTAIANLNSIIQLITNAPHRRAYVSTIIPIIDTRDGHTGAEWAVIIANYNARVRNLVQQLAASGRKVYLVDMNANLVYTNPNPVNNFFQTGDGTHPGLAGYNQMAALWLNAMRAVETFPASSTGTQILTNGSFENDYAGWTKTGNHGIATGGYGTDGSKLIAFNSSNLAPNGVLSQTFSTTAGSIYTLTFDVAALGYTTDVQRLQASVTGASNLLSQQISLSGTGNGATHWQRKSYSFTANGATTTVSFSDQSTTTAAIDLLLDNVIVSR